MKQKPIVAFLALAALFLAGCQQTIEYVGSSAERSDTVDVFYDAEAVERPYSVMGRGRTEAQRHFNLATLQQAMMAIGMRNGADGIIFDPFDISEVDFYSYSGDKQPSKVSPVITATLIRYQ